MTAEVAPEQAQQAAGYGKIQRARPDIQLDQIVPVIYCFMQPQPADERINGQQAQQTDPAPGAAFLNTFGFSQVN